ncbi:MAG: IS4 family transposase, partial [Dehalococcoidia bacterium]
MPSIPQMGRVLQTLVNVTANAAALATGFTKRASKITGALFVQTLLFGWLGQPAATMEALAQTSAALGTAVSASALAQRFTEVGAACLRQVLANALQATVRGERVLLPVLPRFPAVTVQDSTTITLPAALAEPWRGCGGSTPEAGAAALKVQVRFDLLTGCLDVLELTPGRASDLRAQSQTAPLPEGSLKLADLGYVSLASLADVVAQGVHILCRLKCQLPIADETGRREHVAAFLARQRDAEVDEPVTVGAQQEVAGRLLAQRVPLAVAAERRRKLRAEAKREGHMLSADRLALCDWTFSFTTLPVARLTLAEALVVARLRWQVELLFKLWKSEGKLDESRGSKPLRILGEVYAKLLAMVVQHWLLLTTCWQLADRSLVKASHTLRRFALSLAISLADLEAFVAVVEMLGHCLASGCRLSSRASRP